MLLTRTPAPDQLVYRIAEGLRAAQSLTPAQRAQIQAQRAALARQQQAGAPFAEARRLMARAERLERLITYDPARNNAVISDPALAARVRAAVYAHSRAAWSLVDAFRQSRIPPQRALVVVR